jgi:ring-1,2-phenylacetyl-CoA epoxidase subunit PaaD
MVTREQQAVADTAGAVAGEGPRPDTEALWRVLATVPDPEVPVVSVVELGMIRGIDWEGADPGTLVVRLTPTYSGCPATEAIVHDIRSALVDFGVGRVRVEIVLAPAWTTDWIADSAREKLRAYGIAPPCARAATGGAAIDVAGISPLRRRVEVVCCPRCGSASTERVSQFGSTACKAHYRCRGCLEPFDYFKPH